MSNNCLIIFGCEEDYPIRLRIFILIAFPSMTFALTERISDGSNHFFLVFTRMQLSDIGPTQFAFMSS